MGPRPGRSCRSSSAVRKLTGEPADIFGFVRRGYLREGYWADVCVFDPATVAPGPMKRLRDFPAGGERLTAEQPTGIRHVLVNGVAHPGGRGRSSTSSRRPPGHAARDLPDGVAGRPMRPLPELTPWNEWFWTSGADGSLRIQGCCRLRHVGPPAGARSARCAAAVVEPTPVSGRATVVGYTINQHQWHPDLPPPYAIAVVALAEDPAVRLTTNIVGCDADDVARRPRGPGPVRARTTTCGSPCSSRPARHHRRSPTWPHGSRCRAHRSATSGSSTHAVLSGVGRSALGRRLMVDPLSLTVDACLAAVADAGVELSGHRRPVHLSGRRRAWG